MLVVRVVIVGNYNDWKGKISYDYIFLLESRFEYVVLGCSDV